MSRKQYKHLLYTNFANIATIVKNYRKNDKRNNKKAKAKS
jgi:hypothetical protein